MIPRFSVSELLRFWAMLAVPSRLPEVKDSQRRSFVLCLRVFFLISGSAFGIANPALATTCTTVTNGPWSSPSVWTSGILPNPGDTIIINHGDSVWLDESTPALAAVHVDGWLSLGKDTLFLRGNRYDTIVTINGTLDADTGWFYVVDSVRAIVRLSSSGRFRTAAAFPYVSLSIFDSSITPFFACDSGSTFEYYSHNLDLIDITYLANNIIGGKYWNLTLTGVNASLRSRPLAVRGTFRIGFGSSVIPGSQQITIFGDVVNENAGESGAPGAGLRGCGMQSSSFDNWIFDQFPSGSGKDTCHWSGPSQLGSVVVRPHTVLSVRYLDDKHCDSLDILTHLTEESMPCGGHVIGKIFSEFTRTLDASNPIDSFYGLGLTIKSGTNPYLGRVRVVRTAGYEPPNFSASKNGLGGGQAVLRYYRITSSAGPQYDPPNELQMQVHCDEFNGAHADQLHFWRSRDQGATWAFSGLTHADLASNVFVWDTTVLGWPNDSGSFYWTLAEGYADIPLPVTVQNFSATSNGSIVLLSWQPTSEANVQGYEIDRMTDVDSEMIASFRTDADLVAHSPLGSYSYTDNYALSKPVRYDLFEVTKDGIRVWLGSRVASSPNVAPIIQDIAYHNGSLVFETSGLLQAQITIVDAIGRVCFQNDHLVQNQTAIPITLFPGFYLIEARWNTGVVLRKATVVGGDGS